MPLPLYGSGGRTARTSAAVWPTCCLSMPFTSTSVWLGTSNVIPAGGSTTTGCEKPTCSSSACPRSAAREPHPRISSRFSKPFVTPSTMFATSERVRPWRARSSPRSVGRETCSAPSVCSIFIRGEPRWVSSASGPLTITRPGSTETPTPAGISIGFLPILLNASSLAHCEKSTDFSPDETDDLAADAFALSRPARDEAFGRGHDRRAHSPQNARQAILASVHAAARVRDALQVGEDALTVRTELEF